MKETVKEERNEKGFHNLFYGLLDNNLKHISEVKNGLNCSCICPSCEKKLIAKNGGKKKVHHFAHYESNECKYGVQTSIHLAAKNIFTKIKSIKIPEVNVWLKVEIEDEHLGIISHGEFIKFKDEHYVEFVDVKTEKKLHSYIPDVVLVFSSGKRLIVEIAVTHFVGREKLENIKDSKVSAIEIDLSDIKNDFSLEELEKIIIHHTSKKTWLYNDYISNNQKAISQIEKETERLILELKERTEAQKQEREEKRRKEEEEQYIKERLRGMEQHKFKTLRDIKATTKQIKQEEYYKPYYKEIAYVEIEPGYVIARIKNCPLKKRVKNGKYFADVHVDCIDCSNFREVKEHGKYLICRHISSSP